MDKSGPGEGGVGVCQPKIGLCVYEEGGAGDAKVAPEPKILTLIRGEVGRTCLDGNPKRSEERRCKRGAERTRKPFPKRRRTTPNGRKIAQSSRCK